MLDAGQIFTFLFLMLGPFKILGPFARMTAGAEPKLITKVTIRAILVSTITLLLAAVIGESMLTNFGIPLAILALAAGIILFLVALQNILSQFDVQDTPVAPPAPLAIKMAVSPLAFPTIVTPYGIGAVIVFVALSPDTNSKMIVGAIVLGIMVLNLIFMLINRYIFKVLIVILPILGAVIGMVQVALGLKIIYNSIVSLLHS